MLFTFYFQAHDFMSVDDLRKVFQVEHHSDGKLTLFLLDTHITIINLLYNVRILLNTIFFISSIHVGKINVKYINALNVKKFSIQ